MWRLWDNFGCRLSLIEMLKSDSPMRLAGHSVQGSKCLCLRMLVEKVCATMPAIFTWAVGTELRTSCSRGKHFTA